MTLLPPSPCVPIRDCGAPGVLQASNALVVMKALKGVKEVDAAVEALDHAACDTLMKYIYRGMRATPEDSGTLLRWHAAVSRKAGLSPIVRVLADRKTL